MDGLGGFSQGLARGTEGLANQVQASRELDERKRQFKEQRDLTLASQGFMVDPEGNIVVNPDSQVTKARDAEMQRVLAETGKIQGDTFSPEERQSRADLTRTQAEGAKFELGTAKKVEAGREASNFYARAPEAQLRGMEAGSRKDALQGDMLQKEIDNYATTFGLSRRQQEANIAATEEGTEASKANRALAGKRDAREETAAGIQNFAAISQVLNDAVRTNSALQQAGVERQFRFLDLATKLALTQQDAVGGFTEFLTQQWSTMNPGRTPGPTDVKKIQEAAALFGPNMAQVLDMAAGIIQAEPVSAPVLVADLEQMMSTIEQSSMLPPEKMEPLRKMFKAQAHLLGAKIDLFKDDVAPTSQPTTTGGKAPGLPQPRANPIDLMRQGLTDPTTPKAESPLKFPEMPTDQLKAASRQVVDTAIEKAYAIARDDAHRKALQGVAGAPTLGDAIKRLNKRHPGQWAIGPNSEIVALPRSKELAGLYETPVDTSGLFPVQATLQEVIDDLSEDNNYAETYTEMVSKGKLDSNADPTSLDTLKRVTVYFGGLLDKNWRQTLGKGK